ncbi:MAG: DMT family transporter [Bacteroidetes bacterium]|nr:DMT family transporter [Bacteroidota bacterium]
MISKNIKGHTALFVAQIIYALNYSIAKDLMPNYLSPFALVFLRIIGACALFWLLSLFTPKEKIEKKDLLKLIYLSLFGVVINQIFFIWGLSKTTPINSSVIMIINPIFVFIIALITSYEKLNILNFSGLVIAFIGGYIILHYRGNFEVGSTTLAGDIMTLVNAISWAVFVILIKPIMIKYKTITVMKWVFLFGSIFIFPIAISQTLETHWLNFTFEATMAVLFVVVATTFFAYLLNLYGLQSQSATVVSMYIYLQPFFAASIAIILGKDSLTFTKIISGIFIVLGLILVNFKPKKRTNLS